MKIIVRPGMLNLDGDGIVSLLSNHLNPLYDRRRFEWQYQASPEGLARNWIAEDLHAGAPIGIASAFPRRIYVENSEKVCWLLGDFCIADSYRSFFLLLHQEIFQSVFDAGKFESLSFMVAYGTGTPNGRVRYGRCITSIFIALTVYARFARFLNP